MTKKNPVALFRVRATKRLRRIVVGLWIAVAVVSVRAQTTLTDNFNISLNYLTDGVAGTIWDGVYFGAGEFANTGTGGGGLGNTIQCDANISTTSNLTLQTTGTAWEGVDDDGFFLFKVVRGDFSAVVHVVPPYNNAGYNTAGLQARAFSAGGNPFGGSEDYVSWTRFDEFGFANYLRSEVNGAVTQVNPGCSPNSAYWLRMDRVANTFRFYQRTNSSDAWTLVSFPAPVSGTSLSRADLAGQPLQVGIMHATFNNQIGVQFSDFSISATNFDTYVSPPPATGLALTPGTNFANISWVPDVASSGSVVVISAGSGPIKEMPVNGTTYVGNSIFGLGDLLLATNYYVAYSGSATNVTVTNLPVATSFNVAVYGYAGSAIAYSHVPAAGSFSTPSPVAPPNTNIVVDPVTSLTNYTSLAEWNTNGNFESWTSNQVSSATVLGGILSGTANGSAPQVAKLNFAGGPDLDLGYNDQLELRVQVPADFTGNLQIYYGVTNTPGINSARLITIPNANIPKDGAFHVYRIDVGLEILWRGTLRDLQINPLGSAAIVGQSFAIDYLRVGDLTGEVYQPRYTTECPAAGGTTPPAALIGPNQTVLSVESKHFRFLWNAAVATNSFWTANMPHGTLRNAEEVWQVYVKKLGYREPCFATGTQSGTKYKVNITTWHSGYWEGGDTYNGTTLARFNATPDGLRVDPPTLVLPHELMHAFQMHNTTGYVPGSWWEGHANYGRERWLQHYGTLFASNARSGIDPTYLRCAHQLIAEGRDYYLSWPLFLYLDENPDGLADLGEGTMVKLWQQCQINEYPLMTLERLTPTNNIKDIVGYFARREATFNYKSKADIQAALATFNQPLDNAATARWQFTDLVQRSDDTNWWRVPFEMAPMQGAYAIHELVPVGSGAGRVVTVNLHGLPNSARGADWRASFIIISDSGVERYSTLWGSGSNSVTLAANENKVYLSVAGAPATFYTGSPNNSFAGDYDEAAYPYRSTPSKTRFPYELQVIGATPKQRDNGSTSGLVQHSNGGGYKASTATVASTVYLGPNARVLNTANVSGTARIEDFAVVSGSTVVSGSAVISGHALVRGGTVTGNAKVRDWALVEGGAISGNARVLEHGNIKGGAMQDTATAKGTAASLSGTLAGNAIIDGDYGDFFYGRDLTNRIGFGHLPYVGVPDNFTYALPNLLYADYEFTAAHDSLAKDFYGVTDGYLQGSPVWTSSDGKRSGFLNFNGTNQYVILDRSLSDLSEISITAWSKWSGGTSNQPVWFFGSATNRCMFFTPDDGTGHAKFVIRSNSTEQTLSAPAALTNGAWTHVAVTLSNNATGRLYVNGVLQQQGSITITPDQLSAGNTNTAQHNYLARGADASQPFFNGAVDSLRIYTGALTNGEIAAMQVANIAPMLTAITNRLIGAGITLNVTNTASDADQPWQTLTFSLLALPGGATINTNTGVFTWRPTIAQASTTNSVSVKVTDNGTPNLSATQNFFVNVSPLNAPMLNAISMANGQFNFQVNGDFGPDYTIQASTNLMDWFALFTTNSPTVPFAWNDSDSPSWPTRFYRVLLGP